MGLFSNETFGNIEFEMLKSSGKGGTSPGNIYRSKVPGGWLVALESSDSSGLTFMPDPEHQWNGDSL